MEIKGNGRVSPKGALPKNTKPTKTNKNKQNHQNHQTPPNLIDIKKGMVGDAPPTKKPSNTIKRKWLKPPKPSNTTKSYGNQRKF